jgi:choline dehydrogenase
VGGSSATNNVMALRGHRSGYDEWARYGCHGWSYDSVLPAFKRCERDLDFDDDVHGRRGPVAIRRAPTSELTATQEAFVRACVAAGHAEVADHNAPETVGVGPLPTNQLDGVRQSVALTYLAQARRRANLTIRPNTDVARVLIEDERACGVELADGERVRGETVVLCAGAIGSPAILLRSGIGPPDRLDAVRIRARRALPGVGANLHDHPLLRLPYAARGESHPQQRQTLLTLAPDLQIFPSGVTRDSTVALLVSLVKPYSRGRLRLRDADPRIPPDIDVGLLTHPADLPRLTAGIRHARQLANTAPLRDLLTEELRPDAATDPETAVRDQLNVYQHPVGTCRMGTDPDAVVDPAGRVHGVAGLLVADASIMPAIPRANTNLPTMMIAEHLSARLAATTS